MKSYTLEELRLIFDSRNYLPRDRFLYYFITRYGYTEYEAKEAFDLFLKFPNKMYEKDNQGLLDEIIPKAIAILAEIQNTPSIPYEYSKEKEYRKLIYKENDKINEFVIDMCEPMDIISYAEILKRNVEIIALLSYCTSIYVRDKNIHVFEGDLFDTNDNYWNERSSVYIAQKNDYFKTLLYIKGKGFLLNGKPNIEEKGSYSSHALTLREWTKIGNVVTDLHILSDDGIKKEEPNTKTNE